MTIDELRKPPLDELMHYGKKGMRWGVVNEDDTIGSAGKGKTKTESAEIIKAREMVEQNRKKVKVANQKLNKETGYGMLIPSEKTFKAVTSASLEYKYSKQDLTSAKILDRLKTKEKSNAQLSMEEKYKQKGMSNDEAAVAAYQNIRTKKILTVVGGVALTAAAGYAVYKIHDARVDKIIKSGTLLQHISPDSTTGIRDAFYSSSNKLDKIKYRGLYGSQITQASKFFGGNAFSKEVHVLSDIKQASYKNAQDTLSELIKNDKEFAKAVKDKMQLGNSVLDSRYMLRMTAAQNSLAKGVVDKNVYGMFNASLVDHSPDMQKLTDTYFEALSKKGYNAIRDVNDVKYSGYKSINPIIAFNTKGLVDVVDVKQLTDNEISKAKKIAYTDIIGSKLLKQGAAITAVVLASKEIEKYNIKTSELKIANQYRQKNPGTTMTNTEIIRMLERSK